MSKKYKTLEGAIADMRSANVDFIQEYQNAISEEMCDYFISKFEKLDKEGKTREGQVQGYENGELRRKVNKEAKSSSDIFLDSDGRNGCFNMSQDKKDKEMFDRLANAINRHIYLYSLHTGIDTPEYLGINKDNFHLNFKNKEDCPEAPSNIMVDSICLRKYNKNTGGYYLPHYDAKSNVFRIVALIIYLNDTEHGGETEFPVLNRMIVPKRRSLVIFPSLFTHWHYGRKSNTDKYILISHISKYPPKDKEKE